MSVSRIDKKIIIAQRKVRLLNLVIRALRLRKSITAVVNRPIAMKILKTELHWFVKALKSFMILNDFL